MRPPRPAARPRPRVLCPMCRTDVAVSAEGRLSKHKVVITPYWIKVWCAAGGTVPEGELQPVPPLRGA